MPIKRVEKILERARLNILTTPIRDDNLQGNFRGCNLLHRKDEKLGPRQNLKVIQIGTALRVNKAAATTTIIELRIEALKIKPFYTEKMQLSVKLQNIELKATILIVQIACLTTMLGVATLQFYSKGYIFQEISSQRGIIYF